MVSFIKQFFTKYVEPLPDAKDSTQDHSLQVATAALLIEMMQADGNCTEEETGRVLDTVKIKFHLSGEESGAIMELARQEISKSTGFYEFTTLLNRELEYSDKVHIIEHLWEIAFADASIDKYEEHMVRKIADLLYVTHRDFINTKLRVKHKEAS